MATALPAHASIHKRKLLPEILRSFVDPLVAVTIMTAASLILAVLAVASDPPSKKILTVCGVIGLFGLLTVICEIRRLIHVGAGKKFISSLLTEGEHLTHHIITNSDHARYQKDYPLDTVDGHDHYVLMTDWCRRVEDALREYLGEGYVTRFHLGGSIERDRRSMTIWKTWHRLEPWLVF